MDSHKADATGVSQYVTSGDVSRQSSVHHETTNSLQLTIYKRTSFSFYGQCITEVYRVQDMGRGR